MSAKQAFRCRGCRLDSGEEGDCNLTVPSYCDPPISCPYSDIVPSWVKIAGGAAMKLGCYCNHDRCDKSLTIRRTYINSGQGAILAITWSDCHKERLDASISLDLDSIVKLRNFLNEAIRDHGGDPYA